MDSMGLMKLAGEAYNNGDLPTALHYAKQALDLDPAWPLRGHVLHGMALISSEMGDMTTAVEYWREFFAGVDASPDFPALKVAQGHYNFGWTLRTLRRYDEAIAHYATALPTMVSENYLPAWCYRNLAWTYCLMGKADEAETALNAARLYPNDAGEMSHQLVGEAFLYATRGDAARAAVVCDALLASPETLNDTMAQACWLMGSIALSSGNVYQAAAWVRRGEGLAKGDASEARLMADLNSLKERLPAPEAK